MSEFDSTKQKLRKLWERTEKNENDLDNLNNIDQRSFLQNLSSNQISKPIIEIYDSGFFTADAGAESANSDIGNQTVNKTESLPVLYNYNTSVNLELPESFLPYIKMVVDANNAPGTELALGQKFTASRYDLTADTIEITGDGARLFKGNPQKIDVSNSLVNTLLSFFTTDELTEFEVPIANTKEVWKGDIEYNDGIDDFKIVGPIGELEAIFNVGTGCNSNDNLDIYDSDIFEESVGLERGDNEITDLTSTSFTMTARKTETRWVNVPPCTQQDTILEGESISSTFGATQSYKITIRGAFFKKIAGNFVLQGNNQQKTVNTTIHTVNSQDFEFIGRRAYYSSATEGILSVRELITPDGNTFNEIELNSETLPDTDDGHTLPYTTIKLLRNQLPAPEIVQEEEFIPETFQTIKELVKMQENLYHWSMTGRLMTINSATEDDPDNRQFPVYDDSYTVSGTTYILTSENHSFSTKTTYVPIRPDLQVRVRLYLQNPLYWKENRRYDI